MSEQEEFDIYDTCYNCGKIIDPHWAGYCEECYKAFMGEGEALKKKEAPK